MGDLQRSWITKRLAELSLDDGGGRKIKLLEQLWRNRHTARGPDLLDRRVVGVSWLQLGTLLFCWFIHGLGGPFFSFLLFPGGGVLFVFDSKKRVFCRRGGSNESEREGQPF